MLTLDDCIAMSGLTEEEVLAIAEHERIPDMAACALGEYLLHEPEGLEKIRNMIVEDIWESQRAADKAHTQMLLHVLHHFLRTHPEACPSEHPWSAALKQGD